MISLEKPCQYDTPDIFIARALAKPLCNSDSGSGDIEGWETDGDNNEDGEDW